VAATRSLPVQGETPPGLPPSLPLAHFAVIPVWLALGAGALVAIAPDLAAGNIFAPRVFAATHLFTLGIVATAIFGALYQFVPAVLGVPIRSAPVARAGHRLLAAGIGALVAGFWWWNPAVQGAGWLLLFAAVGCSSWNVLPARRRATRNRVVGLYLSLSHSWLGLAMAVGVARIGSGLGWWHTDRAGLVAAHFHMAALGFATLTVVGIGSLMIPGFLASKGHSERPLGWIGWVSSAGLALFSAGELSSAHAAAAAGAAAMVAGQAGHLAVVAGYFRRRAARRAEPGLGFIAAAFVFQAGAAIGGVLLFFRGGGPSRGWAAYAILALLGWLVQIVLGVMHRVVPRLLAQRIAARRAARTTQEGRAELLHEPLAWASLALLGLGTAGLAAAVLLGSRPAVTAASAVYAAGTALVLAQGARLGLMLRPTIRGR
jgi:hypothetical protein